MIEKREEEGKLPHVTDMCVKVREVMSGEGMRKKEYPLTRCAEGPASIYGALGVV